MLLARILLLVGPAAALGGSCDGGGGDDAAQPPPEPAKQALLRARDLFRAEQPVQAADELRRAVALAPDWAEARLQLGKLLLTLCSVRFSTATFDRACLEQAVLELERACALDPKSAEAAYWTGRALGKVPNIPVAMIWLETALKLDPRHGLALKELGLLCAQEGDVARAKDYLQRAREVLVKDDEVLLQLGMLLESEDDLEGAKAAFLRASELNPAHPGPLTRLVWVYRRLGDTAASERMTAELTRCKDFGKRLTQAMQAYEANRLDFWACFKIAQLYREMGMKETARSWAERAQRIGPEYQEARDFLKELDDPDPLMPLLKKRYAPEEGGDMKNQ